MHVSKRSVAAMTEDVPKVLKVERKVISPWLKVVARDVEFPAASSVETYYAIAEPDYVVVLAVTPEARVLLVRQYRPAIERFSLELPAGMVDPDEDPLETARRELLEETGYSVLSIERIGNAATCSSRISNTSHSFFVRVGERKPGFVEERGVEVRAVPVNELRRLVLSGEFGELTHLGVLALASARGLLTL
jgi:ADP-ribose pyrophosphatase